MMTAILVGSEPLKFIQKKVQLQEYSGLVDNKYLPVINPAMLAFKPEAQRLKIKR